jgi:hypothetical protein
MKTATTTTAKANKSAKTVKATTPAKPWSLHGRTAERFELEDINEGDKVRFLLNGKQAVGTFKYAKASIRHKEGKAYIEKGNKIYKRVLEHVTAMPAKA